ncbi:MAG: DUF2934 domain-containing protein [Limisphaerales bacterium]
MALHAFLIWEKEGRQPGREQTYWSCVRQVLQMGLGHGHWVKRGGADSEPFSSPRHRSSSYGGLLHHGVRCAATFPQ